MRLHSRARTHHQQRGGPTSAVMDVKSPIRLRVSPHGAGGTTSMTLSLRKRTSFKEGLQRKFAFQILWNSLKNDEIVAPAEEEVRSQSSFQRLRVLKRLAAQPKREIHPHSASSD
ncbi:hypothetical protein AOLI_G00021810 [Acnodon oligacanthus]